MSTQIIGTTQVGQIGWGAMGLCMKNPIVDDKQAFETIKTAIDLGANCMSSADFYGRPPNMDANLQIFSRFFEAEPTYADKMLLTVKGAFMFSGFDTSPEGIRGSVEKINLCLKTRKMDLFLPARLSPKDHPVEEVITTLVQLQTEGHFKYIGLSEVGAETIRRASKIGKVDVVEVEFAPWTLDILTNGVLDVCKELNIPIMAYSPLGRGFMTGQIKSLDDLPADDLRRMHDRFSAENFHKNLELVDQISAIASRLKISNTQLILAWIVSHWEGIIPIPGSTRAAGVQEAVAAGGIKLAPGDLDEINKVIHGAEISGGRYNAHIREKVGEFL